MNALAVTGWQPLRGMLTDGAVAGLGAAVVGAIPSTVHAVLTGRDVREATLAAGAIALPRESRESRLVASGVITHVFVSAAWGVVLAAALPRRHTAAIGALAGLMIAAVDLGLVGRRVDRITELPLLPQLADHALYGTTVGVVLGRHRGAHRGARWQS